MPAGRAVLQFPAHERARDQRACRVLDMVLIHSFARSFIHPECELSVRRVPGQGTEPDSTGDPAFGGRAGRAWKDRCETEMAPAAADSHLSALPGTGAHLSPSSRFSDGRRARSGFGSTSEPAPAFAAFPGLPETCPSCSKALSAARSPRPRLSCRHGADTCPCPGCRTRSPLADGV